MTKKTQKLVQLMLKNMVTIWIVFSLSGCAGVLLGGAAAGVSRAKNERKELVNTQIEKPKFETKKIERSKTLPPNIIVNKKKKAPRRKVVSLQKTHDIKPNYPKFNSLKGLEGQHLKNILGTPDFIRRDGIAEIWFYKGALCKLHVFLYKNLSTNLLSVKYLEADSLENRTITNDDCAKTVIKTYNPSFQTFPKS